MVAMKKMKIGIILIRLINLLSGVMCITVTALFCNMLWQVFVVILLGTAIICTIDEQIINNLKK